MGQHTANLGEHSPGAGQRPKSVSLPEAFESQTDRYVDLSLAEFLRPLGIRHFYDAFSLHAEISI